MVSINGVAVRAGVSVGTVSNVLNRPGEVADRTRSRVQAAIEELGYVRNESARQLRAGRSRTIGVVVLDVAIPFSTDVARGVEAMAEEVDAVVTLCNSGNDLRRQQRHVDTLAQQRVRGVLITPVGPADGAIDHLVDVGVPVVLLDRVADDTDRCSVSVDDVHGGRIAGEHLAEQGHRTIAFAGGPFEVTQVQDRLDGLRDGAAGAEVVVLETEGLGILAIVGYDDIDFAAAAAVPLSSVRQPREQLGRAATELLLQEADDDGSHHHRQVVFRPDLVVRASSDHRAAPGSLIA